MDLGCGEGRLLQRLLDEPRYRDINRADVSARSLEIARRRLGLRKMKTAGTASACCTVVLTTPNREYHVRFENMRPNGLRDRDHRFEWTRAEFETWALKALPVINTLTCSSVLSCLGGGLLACRERAHTQSN